MELQLRTREREGYPEDLPAFFEMLASGRNPFVPGKAMVFGWRDDRTVTLELRSAGRSWTRNGERCPVGQFQIGRIDAQGNVDAGCHHIEWPEIERCALALNLLPE